MPIKSPAITPGIEPLPSPSTARNKSELSFWKCKPLVSKLSAPPPIRCSTVICTGRMRQYAGPAGPSVAPRKADFFAVPNRRRVLGRRGAATPNEREDVRYADPVASLIDIVGRIADEAAPTAAGSARRREAVAGEQKRRRARYCQE